MGVEPALKLVVGVYGVLVAVTFGLWVVHIKNAQQAWVHDFGERLKSWWCVNTTIGFILISRDRMGCLIFAVLLVISILEIWKTRPNDSSLMGSAALSLIVASAFAPVCIILFRGETFERALLCLAILLTQLNDIYQYCVGRALGRRALAPRISPSKTIEGAMGGILLTAVTSLCVAPLVTQRESFLAISLGIGVGVLGICGDLAYSVVKRRRGIKDFGSLLPGQGGLLDRLDSLTLVVPALFLLMIVSGLI
ncbi:MAG: phosphatidate cytidylyltransferase [Opitutales bacterium]|nr:phosphatidate cytidylyltransferase [Opitutales bacterium]NRA25851.1 phosphatidate cytidylyltransferase [Opitutales bacterium]